MSDTNGTPAAWHGVPRPEALDEALAHARGILGNPAVAGADHISGGDPGRAPEDDELETVPEHHNDLGDWCPSSGGRTADGTCPQYCRHADELVGFDAGERDEDDPAEDDPAELSRQATRRCALCGSLGDLEPINAGPSLACVNTDMCQLRAITSDPLELLARAARGTAKDVTRLSEIELARVILTLKRTVVAAEIELGNNRDRARGDAALAQAAGEMGPRTPPAQELACCTSAIGPVCRHRTTPVADALQEVNYWQDKKVIVSHPSGDGELAALRKLADAVRSHGIGADLAARRGD